MSVEPSATVFFEEMRRHLDDAEEMAKNEGLKPLSAMLVVTAFPEWAWNNMKDGQTISPKVLVRVVSDGVKGKDYEQARKLSAEAMGWADEAEQTEQEYGTTEDPHD